MPFQIIRGDIKTASGDARVEPFLDRTGAAEALIHPLKGMDQYHGYDELGTVSITEYSLTRASQKESQYVIRTPVPYEAVSLSEPNIVRHCYKSALKITRDFGLKSVAFPLIGSADQEGSKELALKIAVEEIRGFLNDNEDTDILLVVRDKLNFLPDTRLRTELSEFIHGIETQKRKKQKSEWDAVELASTESFPAITDEDIEEKRRKRPPQSADYPEASAPNYSKGAGVFHPRRPRKEERPTAQAKKPGLLFPFSLFRSEQEIVLDESFSQMLLRIIDEKGFKKDSDFYKKANITKQTFSKMKAPDYHPKKTTAVAAAIALELSLDGTNELLMKAGYCLSHSLYFDMIVEYFILNGIYDVDKINISLFDYDQPLLGG